MPKSGTEPALRLDRPATLIGGGQATRGMLAEALALAPRLIAADGGANLLRDWGLRPEAIVGDMDSIEAPERFAAEGARMLRVDEQDTTDLAKCLYSVEAPAYIGVGFLGRRFDHALAALHALLARPEKRILLIGEEDVVFLVPPDWRVRLAPGARVSFVPLRPTRGLDSEGLEWPIDGLDMEIGRRVGVSNRAVAETVAARFDGDGVAAMVERRFLRAAFDGLLGA